MRQELLLLSQDCFTISILRNDLWREVCHPHAPNVAYKFFTEGDADEWVRKNLDGIEDLMYEVKPKTLTYSRQYDVWF